VFLVRLRRAEVLARGRATKKEAIMKVIRLVACAGAALALPAWGADVSWLNPAGGLFAVGTNWDDGVAPGPTDHAVFDLGAAGPYTVELGADVTNRDLSVIDDAVTLDLGGRTYELPFGTSAFGYARVQTNTPGSVGRLTLLDGTLTCRGGGVGGGSGTVGAATIATGATWVIHDTFRVAAFGNGSLTVATRRRSRGRSGMLTEPAT
jgi:hypothetical protein